MIALDTIFTATARARIDRGSLCTASIAASVPCPWASGASLATMNADTSAPPKVISGIAHGRVNPANRIRPLVHGVRGVVAAEVAEQELLGVIEREVEDHRTEAGDHPIATPRISHLRR